MKIKQIVTAFLFSFAILLSGQVSAANTNTGDETPKEVRAKQIETRLMQIKHLAKESSLTSAEKQDLRKEVKSLRKEAKNNGIYLSIGAIIVIILLLILILN